MFEKNIEAVRRKNPALAEKIENTALDSITDIEVVEAENQDLIIGYRGMALHSMVDPVREARAIWNKAVKSELKKTDVQIVFGLGLGYLFKRAFLNSNSKVYLVEPFVEILRFVFEHVDLSAELSDEKVYITDNVKDVIDKLREEFLQGDKTEFIFLPAYASLAKDTLEDLTERMIKIIEEKSSDVNTIFKLAPRWVRNLLRNMPFFSNIIPLGFLKEKFVGKTALIVAAGPSLIENIEKIKQNKDKFVIIAAGKAIKVLAENDIVPDFVSFADAVGTESQVLGVEDVLEKTNVIVTSRTDFKVVQKHAKNKILYLPETDSFSSLFAENCKTNPGVYKSASSISIINYFIAKVLGFNNIAFVGLDLGFPNDKIYATGEALKIDENGYIEAKDIAPSTRKVKYVKNVQGDQISTRDDYLIFIRQFEEILEEEINLVRVINTSTQGAYVEGMDYVEFDKFLENLSADKFDVDKIVSDIDENNRKNWTECLNFMVNYVFDKKPEIQTVKEESEFIIDKINNLIESIEKETSYDFENEEFTDLKQKCIETRKKILDNLILKTSLQGVLWSYTTNYYTKNMNDREIIIKNLAEELKLFEKVSKVSAQFLNILENNMKKFEQQEVTFK